MTNNNILLQKIGWLIEGADNLFPEASNQTLNQITSGVENNRLPLTIITENGKTYQLEAKIKIKNEMIDFARPSGWDTPSGFFHVFFQKVGKCWHFFQARELPGDSASLRLTLPDTIYFLQKRRYRRIPAPSGTRAIFKFNNTLMDSVHVTDISVGGMLMCASTLGKNYPVNALLSEIFLAIPSKIDGEGCHSRIILPLIRQGKVVRSFVDHKSCLSCYGVSFAQESSSVAENLKELVGGS